MGCTPVASPALPRVAWTTEGAPGESRAQGLEKATRALEGECSGGGGGGHHPFMSAAAASFCSSLNPIFLTASAWGSGERAPPPLPWHRQAGRANGGRWFLQELEDVSQWGPEDICSDKCWGWTVTPSIARKLPHAVPPQPWRTAAWLSFPAPASRWQRDLCWAGETAENPWGGPGRATRSAGAVPPESSPHLCPGSLSPQCHLGPGSPPLLASALRTLDRTAWPHIRTRRLFSPQAPASHPPSSRLSLCAPPAFVGSGSLAQWTPVPGWLSITVCPKLAGQRQPSPPT